MHTGDGGVALAPHRAALGAKLTASEPFIRRRRRQVSTNILQKKKKKHSMTKEENYKLKLTRTGPARLIGRDRIFF